MPLVRHMRSGHPHRRPRTRQPAWRRGLQAAAATVAASLLLPAGICAASAGRPAPDLNALLAKARKLANQINSLSEQADGLRIQLGQARAEAQAAGRTYREDIARLGAGRLAVGRLAAQSYINGGLDSTLQLLTTSTPGTLIGRASVVTELQHENGARLSQIQTAVAAAQRAQQTARQQARQVTKLAAQIAARQRAAQAKARILNSAVFRQAMAVFRETGRYPNVPLPTANTVGAQALRYALSRRGDMYVWGGGGPNVFDCSGLVMWSYAQVSIGLPHFTGAQWNSGVHVSRRGLQPGDLVFFYSDISHVGLYVGNGLMVDAPNFGEPVQVEPINWGIYAGAVRIVG